MTANTYYSPFFPNSSLSGAEGTTKSIITPTELENIKDSLFDLADDNTISASEKVTSLIPNASSYENQWQALNSAATPINTTAVDAAHAAAMNARAEWLGFLSALSPAWNDTSQNSPVDRSLFYTRLSNYTTALNNLLTALNNFAAQNAAWSNVADDNGNRPDDRATAGDALNKDIFFTKGNLSDWDLYPTQVISRVSLSAPAPSTHGLLFSSGTANSLGFSNGNIVPKLTTPQGSGLTYPMPVQAGVSVFIGYYTRAVRTRTGTTTVFRSQVDWAGPTGYIATTIGVEQMPANADTGWVWVEDEHIPPTGATSGNTFITLQLNGALHSHDVYLTGIRVARTSSGATVGADVSRNVRDGSAVVPRTNLLTNLGISSGFLNQGAWATYSVLPPNRLESMDPGATAGDALNRDGFFTKGDLAYWNVPTSIYSRTTLASPAPTANGLKFSAAAANSENAAITQVIPVYSVPAGLGQTYPLTAQAGVSIFIGYYVRANSILAGSNTRIYSQVDWSQSGVGFLATTQGTQQVFSVADTGWLWVEDEHIAPAGSNSANTYLIIRRINASNPHTHDVFLTSIRIAKTSAGATVGADVTRNVRDGSAIVPRTNLLTNLGISAGFLNQGSGATANNLAQLNIADEARLSNAYAGVTAALDDDILTAQEKSSSLLPLVRELEQTYVNLTPRATALGVTTGYIDAARGEWLAALAAITPSWSDISQHSNLRPYPLLSSTDLLTGWSLNSATVTASGSYTTVTDSSTSDYAYVSKNSNVWAATAKPVTFGILVKKDAVPSSTRVALFRVQFVGGGNPSYDFRLDTSTGVFSAPGMSNTFAFDVGEAWFCCGSVPGTTGTTQVSLQIYPAVGSGAPSLGNYQPTATGSISVRDPFISEGGFELMGRFALTIRLNNYISYIEQVRAAISIEEARRADVNGYILDSAAGSTPVSRSNLLTSLGTAAAITGQADWATYTGIPATNMAGRVQYLNTSGNLDNLTRITDRRLTNLYRADGTTAVTEAATITSLGVAQAIQNQGSLAVQNAVNLGSQVTGTLGTGNAAAGLVNSNIAIASNGALTGGGGGQVTIGGLGYIGALDATYGARAGTNVYRSDGITVLSQAELRTAEGISAGFLNQGTLSTRNDVSWGSHVVGRPLELTDGRVAAGLTSSGDIQRVIPGSKLNISSGNLIFDPLLLDTAAWQFITNSSINSTSTSELTALGVSRAVRSVGGGGNMQFNARAAAALPGATYSGSVRVLVKAGSSVPGIQIAVRFNDRSGNYLGQSFKNLNPGTPASDTVYDFSVTGVAPAGTAEVQLAFFAGGWSTGDIFLGSPALRPVATPGLVNIGDTANMIPDADFLDAATTWGVSKSTVLANTTVGEGAGVNKVRMSGVNVETLQTALIACSPGEVLRSGIYIKTVSGTSGNLLIAPQFYNASGTFITWGNFVLYAAGETGRFSTLATAPANTAFVRFVIYNYGNGDRVWDLAEPIMYRPAVLNKSLIREDGTTPVTDAMAITNLGTSAGFLGQGALSTQNTVNLSTQVTGALGTGNAAAGLVNANIAIASNGALTGGGGGQVTIGGLGYTGALNATYGARAGTNVYRTDGTTVLTQAEIRTLEGIAASIVNQGTGAVANNLTQLNASEGAHLAGIETNADVTSQIAGTSEIVINCDHTGDPLDGQLPKTAQFRLVRAGTDITTSATWTRSTVNGSVTSTIGASTGILSITALTTDATLRVAATYNGVVRYFDVKITRNLAPPPATGGGSGGSGGTSANDTTFNTISSTSMATITDELTVTVGSSGQVALTATSAFYSQVTNYYTVYSVWQRWNGSAWVDLTTEVVGNDGYNPPSSGGGGETVRPIFDTDPAYDGYFENSTTVTGLTAGSSQKFRLRARGNVSWSIYFHTSVANAQG